MNTPRPRPTIVSAAFWIWLLSAMAGTVSVVGVVMATNILATMGAALSDDPEIFFAVTGFGLVVAYVALAGVIAQVIVSVFFRDGANWARIVLTVVAALSIVWVVMAPTELFAWVFVVANVIAAVLSYLPASTEFFVRRRRRAESPVMA